MVNKSIIGATCACLAVVSFSADAAIVSLDSSFGTDSITRDTNTGLGWLDLTETIVNSYDDVSTKFGMGDEFEGWR